MFYVYILRSEKDGSYYVGQTKNLEDRLQRHNQGRSGYTRAKGPWKLVYLEEFISRQEALRREREIKSKKRRAYIECLLAADGLKSKVV